MSAALWRECNHPVTFAGLALILGAVAIGVLPPGTEGNAR